MPNSPGPFGWVAPLWRWMGVDHTVIGNGGPLPPPHTGNPGEASDRSIYANLMDGWMKGSVGASLSSFFSEPRTRKELYVLYEKMDMTDMAGSVLDLYAEDATQVDYTSKRALWVTGPDTIVAACEAMLTRLNIHDDLFALTRDVAKYGEIFDRLVYRSGIDGGVRRMISVNPVTIERKEDKEGRLVGYVQQGKKYRNDNSDVSYPWDYAHFRNVGRDRRYPYGTSILNNGIIPWKRAIVYDDWMLGYQIAMHPDRNLILVDGGSASEAEMRATLKSVASRLRRQIIIDPAGTSGKNMAQKYDPWTPMDHIVMAIRGDSRTDVRKISGSGNAIDSTPLKLAMSRFFSACRCPEGFFGLAPGQVTMQPKASLTEQDIRYARAVRRLQASIKTGFRNLCELNLLLLQAPGEYNQLTEAEQKEIPSLDWRRPDNDFKINMAHISFLDELQRLEVEQLRQQVALAMRELSVNSQVFDEYNWISYLLKEVVQIPEEDVDRILRKVDQAEIDNVKAGLLPDGSNPYAAPPPQKAAERADGTLSRGEKLKLSEAISVNPKLRELLSKIHKLERVEEQAAPTRLGLLPDNELIRKGMLNDGLTLEDVEQIVAEESKEQHCRVDLYD